MNEPLERSFSHADPFMTQHEDAFSSQPLAGPSNRHVSDHMNEVDTTNHLSYSRSSSDKKAHGSNSTPSLEGSLDIFRSNVLSNRGVRAVASVFSDNLEVLRNTMSLHGISAPDDITAPECQHILVEHLLQGHCLTRRTDFDNGTLLNVNDPSLCINMSKPFSTAREMTDAFLDLILEHRDDTSRLPLRKLVMFCECLKQGKSQGDGNTQLKKRNVAIRYLQTYRKSVSLSPDDHGRFFGVGSDFEKMKKQSLNSIAASHGIRYDSNASSEELRELIVEHFVNARCIQNVTATEDGHVETQHVSCGSVLESYLATCDNRFDPVAFKLFSVTMASNRMSRNTLNRVYRHLGIAGDVQALSLPQLRRTIKKHVLSAVKGKKRGSGNRLTDEISDMLQTRKTWPQLVSDTLKEKIVSLFQTITNKAALSTFVCASCAGKFPLGKKVSCSINDVNVRLLQRPDLFEDPDEPEDRKWLMDTVDPPPMPFEDGPLKDYLVEPLGVENVNGEVIFHFCKGCNSHLQKGDVPPLSLSNKLYVGPQPPELSDLTVVEEAMIARCRAQCWVIQLRGDKNGPSAQRGMKGHVIVYPQQTSSVARVLPPSIEEITSPLCVVFVGSTRPTPQWIRDHAKPLTVRGDKVRKALLWLKKHNRHYHDIEIDERVLNKLEENPVLPFHIEYVQNAEEIDQRLSRYDMHPSDGVHNENYPYESVLVTDINGEATSNELRAAAMRHVKRQGKGFIQIPRGTEPQPEINNPALLPMVYPTLFPYGLGGTGDVSRANDISIERHIKHLFSLSDDRFREHYSFLFTVFNQIQRKKLLTRAKLRVQQCNFDRVASEFATVSHGAIHAVCERLSRGDTRTAHSREEQRVLKLMREVKAVTASVPGSSSARLNMRNEIKALTVDQGLPHFYLTINPADVYNPLVRFLAGSEIDHDTCMPGDHDYMEQSSIVAKNPAVAAQFFNIFMKAFIFAILGYNEKKRTTEGGILGNVKAYYGCVEAQGRGSLHCHMLVWVEGGLNADEIKQKIENEDSSDFRDKLISFLDDTISNDIPLYEPGERVDDDYDPCTVRGPVGSEPKDQERDLHLLVKRCQLHTHTKTCYKYDKNECRFNLGESNFIPATTYDPETGTLRMRCLHGLVNNFTCTILRAIRCNMDIKFIGTGASAKRVIYYITDYITKSQLKTHIAYAALELAVKKLGEYSEVDDDISFRAKRLLQKCAYSLINNQELSAQQVASYLLDYEDHFTSHRYENLYWMSFESLVAKEEHACVMRNSGEVEGNSNRVPTT